MVGVVAPPDEDRLAHDVVLGHEAPVARVERVVAVVAHHPVIVHLECVACCGFAVDEYLSAAHLKVVALIDLYRPLIDGNVVHVELHGGALLRDPYRSIVVACPSLVAVERIDVPCCRVLNHGHALHEVLAASQRPCRGVCERQVSLLVERHDVFLR